MLLVGSVTFAEDREGELAGDINVLWHGRVECKGGGRLRIVGSDGAELLEELSDETALRPCQHTPIVVPGEEIDGVVVDHAWPCDLVRTARGRLVALLTVRAEGSVEDHRFIYA